MIHHNEAWLPTDDEVIAAILSVPTHFVPAAPDLRQQNWRIYADDAAEPTTALANENVAPTLADNAIIRIRITTAEIGGGSGTETLKIQYSTDNVTFTDMGSGNHWNYANGAATNGNTTTTFKTTDATTKGKYHEDGSGTDTYSASTILENDWAIKPTVTVNGSSLYYFRLFDTTGSIAIALGSGETHPQVTTAASDAPPPPPRNHRLKKRRHFTPKGMAPRGRNRRFFATGESAAPIVQVSAHRTARQSTNPKGAFAGRARRAVNYYTGDAPVNAEPTRGRFLRQAVRPEAIFTGRAVRRRGFWNTGENAVAICMHGRFVAQAHAPPAFAGKVTRRPVPGDIPIFVRPHLRLRLRGPRPLPLELFTGRTRRGLTPDSDFPVPPPRRGRFIRAPWPVLPLAHTRRAHMPGRDEPVPAHHRRRTVAHMPPPCLFAGRVRRGIAPDSDQPVVRRRRISRPAPRPGACAGRTIRSRSLGVESFPIIPRHRQAQPVRPGISTGHVTRTRPQFPVEQVRLVRRHTIARGEQSARPNPTVRRGRLSIPDALAPLPRRRTLAPQRPAPSSGTIRRSLPRVGDNAVLAMPRRYARPQDPWPRAGQTRRQPLPFAALSAVPPLPRSRLASGNKPVAPKGRSHRGRLPLGALAEGKLQRRRIVRPRFLSLGQARYTRPPCQIRTAMQVLSDSGRPIPGPYYFTSGQMYWAGAVAGDLLVE